jgi:predicted metal-binding protein
MIENSEKIIDDIINLGISTATVFPAKDIKFDPIFRDMCKQNVCGRYGKNYMCPPHNGEIEKLKEDALSYDSTVLIQTIHNIEDSFDFEGMTEGGEIHDKNTAVIKKYLEENLKYDKMLILGAGGCKLCEKCGVLDNSPCKFPDKAISSVEGYCMNVADMTNSHGLKYINGENTVSYVSVFLIK